MTATALIWAAGAILAMLLAIFGYLVALTMRVGDVKTEFSRDIEAIKEARKVTCHEHGRQLECLPDIREQLARLVYRQELEDKLMIRQAADAIHSPVHKDRDALMDKLVEGTLTRSEAKRLKKMLQEYIAEQPDRMLRWYACNALIRVQWELRDHLLAARSSREAPREFHHLRH